MEPVIEIKNVSKKYLLGGVKPYFTLRDSIMNVVKNPVNFVGKKNETGQKLQKDEFWALKNVSLSIDKGEIIGIIGRNGAGKTTLLKILSRITTPTKGEIVLRERVSSLLGIGTGFNPELTGRENVFLNGAILGMGRQQIRNKFPEIVDFAEIKEFLDTPVKFYSNGMFVRLAFSIAAHLEPEILVIDEVLAVGDAKFQQKCLGKMDSITREGRTVLFVSHSVGAILRLVDKCIQLDKGEIIDQGDPKDVIDRYLKRSFPKTGQKTYNKDIRRDAQVMKITTLGSKGKKVTSIDITEDICIEVEIQVRRKGRMNFSLNIELINGTQLISLNSSAIDLIPTNWKKGDYVLKAVVPANILNAGFYIVRTFISPIYMKTKKETWGEGLSFEIRDAKKKAIVSGMPKKRAILSVVPKCTFKKIK